MEEVIYINPKLKRDGNRCGNYFQTHVLNALFTL